MKSSLLRGAMSLAGVLTLAAAAGCSNQPTPTTTGSSALQVPNSPVVHAPQRSVRSHGSRAHVHETQSARMMRPTLAPAVSPEAPIPVLSYNGGPLLQSVETYAVFWGPNVNAQTVANIPAFLGEITAPKPYSQMLAEYNINGMTIGSGSFVSSYVDTDAPTATSLTDDQIQYEIARLIDNGKSRPTTATTSTWSTSRRA
jgi:hypothetical protein